MEISRCVVIHLIVYFIYTAGCFGQGQCYGQGCKVQCHCFNNEVCDSLTGQCTNSLCATGWSGPSCQKKNIALNKKVALRKPHSASLAKPAVDGNKTSCFSVSGDQNQRLRVDLGERQKIHSILMYDDLSITLPERMAKRAGLFVVVSPSKTVGDGIKCPVLEEGDISADGVYDMKCSSSIAGRYVYVIKKDLPKTLGMCELMVYVCSLYTWGNKCENTCGHCSNDDTCDHMTGMCPNGCKSGWTGCDCKTAQPSSDGSNNCITGVPTTPETTTESTTETTQKITESTTQKITDTTTEKTTETTTKSTTESTTQQKTETTKQQTTETTTESTTGTTMHLTTETTKMTTETTSVLPVQTTDMTKQSTTISSQQETDITTTDDGTTARIHSTTTEIFSTVQSSSVEESTTAQVTELETTITQSHPISTDSTDSYSSMNKVPNAMTSMALPTEKDSERFGPQMFDNSTVVFDNTTSVFMTTNRLNDTADNVTSVMVTMETSKMDNVTDIMVNTTGNVTDVTTTTLSMNFTIETGNTTHDLNQTVTEMDNVTSQTSGSTVAMNSSSTTVGIIATGSTTQQSTGDPMTGRNSGGQQLNAALYIIVPICIVMFLIFLTLLGVFLFKRRGKKKYGAENGGPRSSVPLLAWSGTERSGAYMTADENDLGDIDGDQRFSSFHKDRPITKAIAVTDLQDHISKMHISQQFKVEYESLPKGLAFLCNVGLLDVNKEKNRYKDLIAYDDSRVILLDDNLYANQDATDYINAGYIDGYSKEKEYIAAQGPKNNTVEDFWKMVWQEKSSIIVMLTNLQEGNKIKCFQYWPNEDHNVLAGDITVSFEREINYPVFVIRKFLLHHTQTEEDRKVSIYHYTAWPDHGLPDPFQILTFHRSVSNHQTSMEEPLIVHCSAGVGRTGVFIGFDILKKQGESTGYVGVLECVKNMRKKRPNMIQTLDQYIFLYVILLEHFACPDAVMNGTSIQYITAPSSAASYKSRVDKEYKALLTMKPKFVQEDYQASLRPENLGKNRDVNILAVDKYRPFLSSTSTQPGHTPYINAVVMPSCSRNDGFLVTQLPLKSTILDFWQMIFDYNSNIIVTLDKFEAEVEDSGIFWPAVGESMVIGSFTVTTVSCTEKENSVAEKLIKLSRKNALDEEEELVIKMLSVTDLDIKENKQQVPLTLISLYSNIQKWQCDNGQWPITVMCRDGASQCGLFCAAVNLIDKIDWYNEIDVFHTVRQLHIRRPEIFSTREQYEMCYQVAKAYMDVSDMYRNQRVEVPQSPV